MNALAWRLLIPAVLAIPAAFAGPYTITSGYINEGGGPPNTRAYGRGVSFIFDVGPGISVSGSNNDASFHQPSPSGDPEIGRAYHLGVTIDGAGYSGLLNTGTLWFVSDSLSSTFTMNGH